VNSEISKNASSEQMERRRLLQDVTRRRRQIEAAGSVVWDFCNRLLVVGLLPLRRKAHKARNFPAILVDSRLQLECRPQRMGPRWARSALGVKFERVWA